MIGLLPLTLPFSNEIVIQDKSGHLRLSLSIDKGCVVRQIETFGYPSIDPNGGVWTGIQVGGKWHSTHILARPPKVFQKGGKTEITGIEYGENGIRVLEGWTFTSKSDSIVWKIDRRYLDGGVLESTAMPLATFKDMATWTGALLGTGGVAWCRLFDSPNATYGVHTDSAAFWRFGEEPCLKLTSLPGKGLHSALRFTREADGRFSASSLTTESELVPKVNKARFLRTQSDIWSPFEVRPNQTVSASIEFKAQRYSEVYGRGDFKSLDTHAITELVNTIGRIGVIDEGLVGSNGWYSGYICMHEPWLARVGSAIDDPNYTQSVAKFLDYAREHAVLPDGMVKSRWKYDAGDAQPGSYDEKSGFYEAQWGRLMDSQTSYVTNVADQFDQSGDLAWLKRQKASCESALEYLLKRDTDGDGLYEMLNHSTSQRRSSDWLDIVWASHENAFVNAQLYGALLKWAEIEELLKDSAWANRCRDAAIKLKSAFNKSIDDGGFWDPARGWYVYWRDADGSVHGNNLTVPVNLTAIGEGICDDPVRQKALLDNIERRMKAESLLTWPACFESYRPGEGADDHFPTYENGDLFLAWAEYGVRAYAKTEPAIALKYIRQIVDQYKRDGLAFQRYLRASGKGAGDDILANNCNVMTGLYRDIFGIRPKYNRLYLEPHITPELDGTRIEYDLRGQHLQVHLSTHSAEVKRANLSIKTVAPFGVAFDKNGAIWFPGSSNTPAFRVESEGDHSLQVSITQWSNLKHLTLTSPSNTTCEIIFLTLSRGRKYHLQTNGKTLAEITAKNPKTKIKVDKNTPLTLYLVE